MRLIESAKLSNNIQEAHMFQDMLAYLPDDILTKVDRATMSVSLESRAPLLDHRIIENAVSMPHYLKHNNGNKKYVLKQILYKYLPEELLDRPKQGFAIPIYSWLHIDLYWLVN